MLFNEPEVVRIGFAEELIETVLDMDNTEGVPEGFPPAKVGGAIYMADVE